MVRCMVVDIYNHGNVVITTDKIIHLLSMVITPWCYQLTYKDERCSDFVDSMGLCFVASTLNTQSVGCVYTHTLPAGCNS